MADPARRRDGGALDARCGSAVPAAPAQTGARPGPGGAASPFMGQGSPRCSCPHALARGSHDGYCTAPVSLRITKLSTPPTPSKPAYLGASFIGTWPSRTSPALALIIWERGRSLTDQGREDLQDLFPSLGAGVRCRHVVVG